MRCHIHKAICMYVFSSMGYRSSSSTQTNIQLEWSSEEMTRVRDEINVRTQEQRERLLGAAPQAQSWFCRRSGAPTVRHGSPWAYTPICIPRSIPIDHEHLLSWCRELWSAAIYLFSWLVSNIIRSMPIPDYQLIIYVWSIRHCSAAVDALRSEQGRIHQGMCTMFVRFTYISSVSSTKIAKYKNKQQ